MLANGTRLFTLINGDTKFVEEEGLVEVGYVQVTPNFTSNTTLKSKYQTSEMGSFKIEDIENKWNYKNDSENCTYRRFKKTETSREVYKQLVVFPDGSGELYDCQVCVNRDGKALDDLLVFTTKHNVVAEPHWFNTKQEMIALIGEEKSPTDL